MGRRIRACFLAGFVLAAGRADIPPEISLFTQKVLQFENPNAEVRIQAQKDLQNLLSDYPRAGLMYLANIYQKESNPEVLYQLEMLLRKQATKVLFLKPPAFLGVNYELIDLPDQDQRVVMVSKVVPNTPADEVGLRGGDIILEIQGIPVHELPGGAGFAEFIQTHLPLEIISLRLKRASKVMEINLKLGLRPDLQMPVRNPPGEKNEELEKWLKSLRAHKNASPDYPVGHFSLEP